MIYAKKTHQNRWPRQRSRRAIQSSKGKADTVHGTGKDQEVQARQGAPLLAKVSRATGRD